MLLLQQNLLNGTEEGDVFGLCVTPELESEIHWSILVPRVSRLGGLTNVASDANAVGYRGDKTCSLLPVVLLVEVTGEQAVCQRREAKTTRL